MTWIDAFKHVGGRPREISGFEKPGLFWQKGRVLGSFRAEILPRSGHDFASDYRLEDIDMTKLASGTCEGVLVYNSHVSPSAGLQ